MSKQSSQNRKQERCSPRHLQTIYIPGHVTYNPLEEESRFFVHRQLYKSLYISASYLQVKQMSLCRHNKASVSRNLLRQNDVVLNFRISNFHGITSFTDPSHGLNFICYLDLEMLGETLNPAPH